MLRIWVFMMVFGACSVLANSQRDPFRTTSDIVICRRRHSTACFVIPIRNSTTDPCRVYCRVRLRRTSPPSRFTVFVYPNLDYTPCGVRKVCMNQICVDAPPNNNTECRWEDNTNQMDEVENNEAHTESGTLPTEQTQPLPMEQTKTLPNDPTQPTQPEQTRQFQSEQSRPFTQPVQTRPMPSSKSQTTPYSFTGSSYSVSQSTSNTINGFQTQFETSDVSSYSTNIGIGRPTYPPHLLKRRRNFPKTIMNNAFY